MDVFSDSLIAHVMGRFLIKETTLAKEQVHAACVSDKEIGPGGVSGKEQPFPPIADFQAQGDLADLMGDAEGKDFDALNNLLSLRLKDMKHSAGRPSRLRGIAEHELKEVAYPLLRPGWSGHMERSVARILIEIIEKKEGHPRAMIAVKMAQKDGIQLGRMKPRPLHGRQCRGTAVQEKEPVWRFYQVTAVVPSPAAKGIAAAENVEFHRACGHCLWKAGENVWARVSDIDCCLSGIEWAVFYSLLIY
jgi:hypothetical protein